MIILNNPQVECRDRYTIFLHLKLLVFLGGQRSETRQLAQLRDVTEISGSGGRLKTSNRSYSGTGGCQSR